MNGNIAVSTPQPQYGTFDVEFKERRGPFKLRLERRVSSDDNLHDHRTIIEWSELKISRGPESVKATRFIFGVDE